MSYNYFYSDDKSSRMRQEAITRRMKAQERRRKGIDKSRSKRRKESGADQWDEMSKWKRRTKGTYDPLDPPPNSKGVVRTWSTQRRQ